MLTISERQFDAFQAQADALFAHELASYLKEEYEELEVDIGDGAVALSDLPADVLLRLVSTALKCARSYGIDWQSSMASFVVLMFVIAPNFDQHAAIQRELQSALPNSAIDVIAEDTSEEIWDEIAQGYSPQAWHIEHRFTIAAIE